MLKNLKCALVPFFVLSVILTSCGYDDEYIRDYQFKTISDNQQVVTTMDFFINEFNTCAGQEIFKHVTNSSTNYNSSISLVQDLQKNDKDGAVGYGTQIITTNEDNPLKAVVGESLKTVHVYTGKVELDSDYVMRRLVNNTEDSQYDLKKLTLHELAHVIGMPHTDSVTDVMYPNISGQKDFDAFCHSVKTHIANFEI